MSAATAAPAVASPVSGASRCKGPRTREGKRRASRNALRHGLYSSRLVVEPEDMRHFQQYRTSLLREINPRDLSELGVFERLLSLQWKLKRLEESEQHLYDNPRPRLEREDLQKLKRMTLDQREHYLQTHRHNRRQWQRERDTSVQQRTLDRFGDIEFMQRHQVRLQNALHRCWRELRVMRKDSRASHRERLQQDCAEMDADAQEPTALVLRVLDQWRREMRRDRQARWRHQHKSCRRERRLHQRVAAMTPAPEPRLERADDSEVSDGPQESNDYSQGFMRRLLELHGSVSQVQQVLLERPDAPIILPESSLKILRRLAREIGLDDAPLDTPAALAQLSADARCQARVE